jgi:hypothetical protein
VLDSLLGLKARPNQSHPFSFPRYVAGNHRGKMVASILSSIDAVGVAVGLGAQQFRFVVCLLSCYPLGMIHRSLPTTKGNEIKHLFATIVGLMQAYACFENDIIHFIVSTLATWVIMAALPKQCGWAAFIYNMAHLTWGYVDALKAAKSMMNVARR